MLRTENAKVCVLGTGGWGLALAMLLNKNGHKVTMWSKFSNEVELLNKEREHKISLPGIKIPVDIKITDDIDEALKDCDIIVNSIPSAFTRNTALMLKGKIKDGQIIVNGSKGIEETTLMTITEVFKDVLPTANVAVISGPSHAEEVGREIPTSVVAGADDIETAEYIQTLFMNNVFRVYTSTDVVGIELGGSLKNVIALAAGMADGLGFGDNTKAALITRGMTEIKRLGLAMGGQSDTFSGLSGMGDLIVTCASMHSRNRRAGILIGKGSTLEEAKAEVGTIVEGAYSAKAAKELANKHNVTLPIINEVNDVLFENKSAMDAVMSLMMRDRTSEIETVK